MHLEHFFRMWIFKWQICWSFTLTSFSLCRSCSLSLNFIAHNMCYISNGHFPKTDQNNLLKCIIGDVFVGYYILTHQITSIEMNPHSFSAE